uniref:Cadherin domain-containing protein n=2 Tax=Panagrellus redivivus TaxID=6233 RepID=A0A7E4W680_PANRE
MQCYRKAVIEVPLTPNMLSFLISAFCVAFLFPGAQAEVDRHLRVSEAVPIGYQVGYVTDKLPSALDQANYYVVFPEPDSMAEKVLTVNENTGEITVIGELDYEKETKLTFLAIPTSGELTIKVVIEIIDENDNAPTFPISEINLEISEYARIDTELVLPSAVDLDSDMYTVKKYATVGGNVNNVFRLSTSKLNNALYVDLVVNGQLDREYRDRYDLVIEATDGGDPPKNGRLTVHVLVLDANDNAPEFSQSRYSAHLTSNATVGTKVTQVRATDADAGDNAKISYKLANSQFNNHELIPFIIDSETGEVTVSSNRLSLGTTYELIVIASDHGVPQALESTVFLTVHVQSNAAAGSANDLNIVWLTEDGSATVLESLPLGYVLARASVKAEADEELTLVGTSSLCIKQTDSPTVYLVLVCGPLDREATPELHLKFVLKADDKVILDHPLIVHLADVNDNPPQWNRTEYKITLNRNSDGRFRSVYRFLATDSDFGENARIHYSLFETDIFSIDSETGVLTVQKDIDCFTADDIHFIVNAMDNGKPPLSSNATVIVDVIDTEAEPPSFEKSLYEVTIKEDADVSTCLIQVGLNF